MKRIGRVVYHRSTAARRGNPKAYCSRRRYRRRPERLVHPLTNNHQTTGADPRWIDTESADMHLERITIADVDQPDVRRVTTAAGLRIVATSQSRGGIRRWFLCPEPACNRRCAVLFIVDDRFMCRSCRGQLDRRRFAPGLQELRDGSSSRPGHYGRRDARRTPAPTRPLRNARLTPPLATRAGRLRRELVENCRRLDVRRLLERFGPPQFDRARDAFICRISSKSQFVLATSTPKFGGIRWWLICPTCAARCSQLYCPPGPHPPDLRCRKCWGLSYRSQLA